MAQAAQHARAAAVLSRATVRAAEQLDLPQRELAKVLGVSTATVSRLAAGSWRLAEGSKSWELAAAFVRLFRSLAAITGGGPETMRARLHSDNDALGARPAERIVSAEGLFDVLRYLDGAPRPVARRRSAARRRDPRTGR